ncbi:hypothetical protein NHX12_032373 [Muraenolepis orangiensis]|uniref:Uncharacterized protein n=1 Tax=Muraenolepis orangiensis TaxID=630683 RepID=A0A9Q0IKK7_9TELE|nr:hypothetical protein NHX12_032373 [Muraenolepis orangiensis]
MFSDRRTTALSPSDLLCSSSSSTQHVLRQKNYSAVPIRSPLFFFLLLGAGRTERRKKEALGLFVCVGKRIAFTFMFTSCTHNGASSPLSKPRLSLSPTCTWDTEV